MLDDVINELNKQSIRLIDINQENLDKGKINKVVKDIISKLDQYSKRLYIILVGGSFNDLLEHQLNFSGDRSSDSKKGYSFKNSFDK